MCIDVCVLSAEREWEVRTAVFLQREASIFRPSVGMWEMSASNWVDKTILSFRRKYGSQHKGATALDNSHREVRRERKAPPVVCLHAHALVRFVSLSPGHLLIRPVKANDGQGRCRMKCLLSPWIGGYELVRINSFCRGRNGEREREAEVISIRGVEGE